MCTAGDTGSVLISCDVGEATQVSLYSDAHCTDIWASGKSTGSCITMYADGVADASVQVTCPTASGSGDAALSNGAIAGITVTVVLVVVGAVAAVLFSWWMGCCCFTPWAGDHVTQTTTAPTAVEKGKQRVAGRTQHRSKKRDRRSGGIEITTTQPPVLPHASHRSAATTSTSPPPYPIAMPLPSAPYADGQNPAQLYGPHPPPPAYEDHPFSPQPPPAAYHHHHHTSSYSEPIHGYPGVVTPSSPYSPGSPHTPNPAAADQPPLQSLPEGYPQGAEPYSAMATALQPASHKKGKHRHGAKSDLPPLRIPGRSTSGAARNGR